MRMVDDAVDLLDRQVADVVEGDALRRLDRQRRLDHAEHGSLMMATRPAKRRSSSQPQLSGSLAGTLVARPRRDSRRRRRRGWPAATPPCRSASRRALPSACRKRRSKTAVRTRGRAARARPSADVGRGLDPGEIDGLDGARGPDQVDRVPLVIDVEAVRPGHGALQALDAVDRARSRCRCRGPPGLLADRRRAGTRRGRGRGAWSEASGAGPLG